MNYDKFSETTYVLVRVPMNWHDAKQSCSDMGGHLMEVRNNEEYQRARLFAKENGSPVWLGGNDLQEEANWVWDSNGEQISLTQFTQFWYKGRPYPNGPLVNCGLITGSRMFDWYCAELLSSVCEYP